MLTLITDVNSEIIHTIQSNQSKYLQPAHSNIDAIPSQKQQALAELHQHLNSLYNFQDIYTVFLAVKAAKTGNLRKHTKNIIYEFGDTDSYRSAIQTIAEKAFAIKTITLKDKLYHFAQYQQLHDLYTEVMRCGVLDNDRDWQTLMMELKQPAFEQLKQQNAASTDLMQIKELLAILLSPTSLPRLERKNILHAYGDTNSYKEALLLVAHKVPTISYAINNTNNNQLLVDCLSSLYMLQKAMQDISFIFSKPPKDWQLTLDKLMEYIHQLHAGLVAEFKKPLEFPTKAYVK